MTITPSEINNAFGKYFPSLIYGVDQTSDAYVAIATGLEALNGGSLSWARLNQIMHRCSQAGMSEGCYRYYFLDTPQTHPYPVEKVLLPTGYKPPKGITEITSLQQAQWGIERFMCDAMLYWGNFRQAYRDLRLLSVEAISSLFSEKRIKEQRIATRGKVVGPASIPRDHRYLISEMACKTYAAQKPLRDTDHVALALNAFRALQAEGIQVTPKILRDKTKDVAERNKQLQLFDLLYEDASGILKSEEEVVALYLGQWNAFQKARVNALQNTQIYLSVCNDLDVYVATSMRTRDDFREMGSTCEKIFTSPKLSKYNIRYFDPTLSASEHHEDKGIIECLMVKTAKVVLYFAQHKESLGKISEYAMALSLGKPVIILCPDDLKGHETFSFYSDSHPLTRLVEFKSGIVNGAMITYNVDIVISLLDRIFTNAMEYDFTRKDGTDAYHLLRERLTGTAVRVVTDNKFLAEAFWNNWHEVY